MIWFHPYLCLTVVSIQEHFPFKCVHRYFYYSLIYWRVFSVLVQKMSLLSFLSHIHIGTIKVCNRIAIIIITHSPKTDTISLLCVFLSKDDNFLLFFMPFISFFMVKLLFVQRCVCVYNEIFRFYALCG